MRTIPLSVFAILVGLSAVPALAADPAPSDATEIHLTQNEQRLMPRDRIRAELRAEMRGNDGKAVQSEVNRKMAAALAKAKARTEITVQTGTYSVFREYDGKGAGPWRASQSVILTSKDFDAVLTVAGELQADGLLMSGIYFFVAPETLKSVQDELTAQAIASLKERANKVATALGTTVLRYKTINVGNVGNQGMPMPRAMVAMKDSSSAAPPVAEAGEETVSISVDAQLLLKTP